MTYINQPLQYPGRFISGEMVRRKHGHTYQATTQGYMHHPDEFVNEEITRAIGSQLDALLGKDKDKDKE